MQLSESWALWSVAAMLPIALVNAYLLIQRLRRAHPDLWSALGGPSLGSIGFHPRGQQYRRFCWGAAPAELGDGPLRTMAYLQRAFDVAGPTLVLLVFLGF